MDTDVVVVGAGPAGLMLAEFQDSIRRVLGADLPLGEVTRLSRYRFQARQAQASPNSCTPPRSRCERHSPAVRHTRHAGQGGWPRPIAASDLRSELMT